MTRIKRFSSLQLWRFLSFAVLNGVLLFGLVVRPTMASASTRPGDHPSLAKIDREEINYLALSRTFTDVAKAVIPSVVSISSIMIIRASDLWHGKFNDKELREFFGEKYLNLPIPREFRQRASGSGIIVSKNGHILTNLHVIDKAEAIQVLLADNRTFNARLVGADPLTEIAIIKIDAENLPVAPLGDSDSLEIGEWVLAIGNPLELRSTVTAGIISAIGRDINIIADTYGVENFIQTDATINPGNSGGALVNLNGEVIGICTAIATQSGYNQGYGFAIPINLAKQIMTDLIQNGFVTRSYLGISMLDVNEKIAKALGLKLPSGVFIDQVIPNGPAAIAGLQEKDVVIKVDNIFVNKGNIVQSLVAQKKPGDLMNFTLIRKSRLLKIPIILGEKKDTHLSAPTQEKLPAFSNLGLAVENISRQLAEELELKIGEGVLVIEVKPFSPAYDAGIQVNDIILEIDDRLITSDFAFNNIIAQLQRGNIYIFKMKRGETIFHCFVEISQ